MITLWRRTRLSKLIVKLTRRVKESDELNRKGVGVITFNKNPDVFNPVTNWTLTGLRMDRTELTGLNWNYDIIS